MSVVIIKYHFVHISRDTIHRIVDNLVYNDVAKNMPFSMLQYHSWVKKPLQPESYPQAWGKHCQLSTPETLWIAHRMPRSVVGNYKQSLYSKYRGVLELASCLRYDWRHI